MPILLGSTASQAIDQNVKRYKASVETILNPPGGTFQSLYPESIQVHQVRAATGGPGYCATGGPGYCSNDPLQSWGRRQPEGGGGLRLKLKKYLLREAIKKQKNSLNTGIPRKGGGVQPLPKCFGALFFMGFTFGQNAKGEGSSYCQKIWSTFKDFLQLDSLQGVFILGKMSKGGRLGACQKNLEHVFQDVYPFRLSKSAGIKNFFSNVCNIFRGHQYKNLRCFVEFYKMLRFTHKKCSVTAQNRGGGGGGSANSGNAHIQTVFLKKWLPLPRSAKGTKENVQFALKMIVLALNYVFLYFFLESGHV